ncbi:MAG: hypothetical protein QW255_03420 [Candidatus Bilamarchaeaceae archaeon]
MFGIAGIRGPYGSYITEELIEGITKNFAEGKIAIGRDIRQSGKSLKEAAIRGAIEAGSDVYDLRIAPTPTVALASKKYGLGAMITASHNPIDHNGIKLMKKGRELTPEEGNTIYQNYLTKKEKISNKKGNVFFDNETIKEHIELIKKEVKVEKKLKVIVDCNGAAAVITPYLIHSLGCDVISINTSLEEFFRPSEPKQENLSVLSSAVRAMKADIGIAHDADADRCIVLDRNGKQIPLDVQLAIMIEEEMKRGAKKIGATVEASLLIRETVEKNNGKVVITPVGSTYLALEIEKEKVDFAGEPCGEYIYKNGILAPDGVMTAAKFVEIASKQDLLELTKKYTTYPIIRKWYHVTQKHFLMEKIKKEIAERYPKFSALDGIRVDEEDGWFLVRASGTEDIIRLTMEYKDEKKLQNRKKEIEKIIRTIL